MGWHRGSSVRLEWIKEVVRVKVNDTRGPAKGSRRWFRDILVLFAVLIVIPMLVRSCVELAW